MKPFDTHCHFDAFENPDKVIEDAKKVISGAIHPGISHKTNLKALEFSKKYKGFVHAALAIHPTVLPKLSDAQIKKELDFIEKNKDRIVAIGEAGLDNKVIKRMVDDPEKEKEKQDKVFRKLIQLSLSFDKPIIVHSRWATSKVLKVLKEEKAKKVVLHSFSGNADEIKEGIKLGYYFSLDPHKLMLADLVPLDKVMLETDSPYLRYEGKPNRPASVKYVIGNLITAKDLDKNEIIEKTNANVKTLFGL